MNKGIDYRRIAETIADVINDELAKRDNREAAWQVAIEILSESGLIDEYRRRRRKQIFSSMLVPAEGE